MSLLTRETRRVTGRPDGFSSFIGRADEINTLKTLLMSHSLVTLTGPAGCGKTRLAQQIAVQIQDDFPHGIFFIDMASLTEDALTAQAIGVALGVAEEAGQALLVTLAATLRGRRCLIVLDNCEHLVTLCATIVEGLLTEGAQLTILATSRVKLETPGEVVWVVPPFTPPPASLIPEDDEATVSLNALTQLRQNEAVQLFLARASEMFGAYDLTPQNALFIARICRQLDGIPLAIEMAVSRLRVLSPAQLAAQLEASLQILHSPYRENTRHQTLDATFEWSYAYLTPEEKTLLRRLAVFRGGCDFAAVSHIASLPAITDVSGHTQAMPRYISDILDGLTRLIENSWVMADTVSVGSVRYRLLEPVRHYLLAKLEQAGETVSIREQHALYYFNTLKTAGAPRTTAPSAAVSTLIKTEQGNLQAAIRWLLEAGPANTRLELALFLAAYYRSTSYLSAGWQLLTEAIAKSQHATTELVADALLLAANTAWVLGHVQEAISFCQRAIPLFEQSNHQHGLGRTLLTLGVASALHGAYDQAETSYRAALEIFTALGDQQRIMLAVNNLGALATDLGQFEAAITHHGSNLKIAQANNDPEGLAIGQMNLGEVYLYQGDWPRATHCLETALSGFVKLGITWGVGLCSIYLGRVAVGVGDHRRAEVLFRDGLTVWREQHRQREAAGSLEGLAMVAAARGSFKRAATLVGAAMALREATGNPLTPAARAGFDQSLATLRAELGDIRFTQAIAEGRAMSFSTALDYGFVEEAPPPSPGLTTSPPRKPSPQSVEQPDATAHAELRVFGFGYSEIYRDDYLLSAPDWTYSKPKELLFYLLFHKQASREEVGTALWPKANTKQLTNRLNDSIYHLRLALGATDWVEHQAGFYHLSRSRTYWFDVEEFERDGRDLTQTSRASKGVPSSDASSRRERLAKTIKLYRDDLLLDLPEADWLNRPRDMLRGLYHELLLALGTDYFEIGRVSDSIPLFESIINRDPYHEKAHAYLIRCVARLQEPGKAVRLYHAYEQLLRREFDIAPSMEIRVLMARLKSGDTV